ncbi:diguanylate cyclase [Undibacterium sp. TC4M20W]|uniref:diguanylate cyclase n=1 Tax=Undibacterium sp. TC4M20W TaxID=3413052 RepID=UPI003BF2B642
MEFTSEKLCRHSLKSQLAKTIQYVFGIIAFWVFLLNANASLPLPKANLDASSLVSRWSSLSDTVFRNFSVGYGLPHPIVTAIAEDGDGFIWAGTQDGLARWDGYRFRVFGPNPLDPNTLPDNFISALHTDRQGRLWVGTGSGGLARYDRDNDRFIRYPSGGANGLSDVAISNITDDDAKGMWITTNGGLDHLDQNTGAIKHIPLGPTDASPLERVKAGAALHDSRGNLWVGTNKNLLRRERGGKHFVPVTLTADANAPQPAVRHLYQGSDGHIWVGTKNSGAFVLDPVTAKVVVVTESGPTVSLLSSQAIDAIVEVHPGEIWLGTHGHGIVVVDTATMHTRRLGHDPKLEASLSHDNVWAMLHDRAGQVWVGTNHGLGRHDPTQTAILTLYGDSSRPNGIFDSDIESLLVASDRRIWLGFGIAGMDAIDPELGRVTALRPDPTKPKTALPHSIITSMVAVPDGDIYVATLYGLYRLDRDEKNLTRVDLLQNKAILSIRTLRVDGKRLWIGTQSDGLLTLDFADKAALGVRAEYTRNLTDQRILAIEGGKPGSWWICTRNGLNLLDSLHQTIERILPDATDPKSLSNGYVSTALTDLQGRLWLGTQGGGINVLESRNAEGRPLFKRLGIKEGLPNANINKLLLDGSGNIWASTDKGLAVVDARTFAIRALQSADGVAIPTYWNDSGAVTTHGELLFGGLGGLTVVRPELVKAWTYRPPVVATDVRLGGKLVPSGRFNGELATQDSESLIITPEANSVAVEFAALDYTDPERNRYAYRLEGFEEDWVDTDPSRRIASYTNLPPGKYTLHVRGANRAGMWTEKTLDIPIRVLPAWYQTWLFRIAILLLAILFVWQLVKSRTAQLNKAKHHLESLVNQRTEELFRSNEKLTQQALQLELLAFQDTLTGIANRRRFTERFDFFSELANRNKTGFTLLLIDLDKFKAINDTYGHDAGDAVLVATARQLTLATRAVDVVARLGGDEFAVLLESCTTEEAIRMACERIMQMCRVPIAFSDMQFTVSMSIGASVFGIDGSKQAELYAAADLALYAAKRDGRNTWRMAGKAGQQE